MHKALSSEPIHLSCAFNGAEFAKCANSIVVQDKDMGRA